MPKKYTTPEEIAKAWERKRERDRKAQATYIATHHDIHLERMKEQYKKKKAEKKRAEGERTLMAMEDVNVAVKTYPKTADGVKAYKRDNPSASQRKIAEAVGISQATVSRYLKK